MNIDFNDYQQAVIDESGLFLGQLTNRVAFLVAQNRAYEKENQELRQQLEELRGQANDTEN